MKKIIFGVLFIAIVASLAFAAMYLCDATASGFGQGWTMTAIDAETSVQVTNTSTGLTNSSGYFLIPRRLVPTGTQYYIKATKIGELPKYSNSLFTFGGSIDHLGTILFGSTNDH